MTPKCLHCFSLNHWFSLTHQIISRSFGGKKVSQIVAPKNSWLTFFNHNFLILLNTHSSCKPQWNYWKGNQNYAASFFQLELRVLQPIQAFSPQWSSRGLWAVIFPDTHTSFWPFAVRYVKHSRFLPISPPHANRFEVRMRGNGWAKQSIYSPNYSHPLFDEPFNHNLPQTYF